MKKFIFLLAGLLMLTAGSALAQNQSANLPPDGLPADFKEFKTRYQQYGTTPEGAMKMYFDAVFCYLDSAHRDEAVKMLRYSMHAKAGWERSPNYATFVSRLKDPGYRYIFQSFAKDTSPQNNYAMNPNKYRLNIHSKRPQSDYLQVNIVSSGADSPRLTQMQKFDDGLWYLTNNAGTYSDVRKPASTGNNNSHDADFD